MDLESRRAEVVRDLHAAAAAGTLNHSIAMSRLQRADQATTLDELDVLVAGLALSYDPGAGTPTVGQPIAVEPYPAMVTAPTTADPGSSAGSPIAYRTGWRTLVVQGDWRVPAYLLVDSGYGSVVLDFMAAVPDASVINLKLVESHGWTKLIVPQGWGVNTDDVVRTWGYIGTQVPAVADQGMPQVLVTGNLGSGYLSIRNQKPRDRRRLERYLAKQRELTT